MRYRGISITTLGATLLLLSASPSGADAQRGRLGVLRPAPTIGVRGRSRIATIAPQFVTTCFLAPSFPAFPFSPFFRLFGASVPFVSEQLLAGGTQPSPDPSSHIAPDPGTQPVPFPGSAPIPGIQPVPQGEPVPGANAGLAAGAVSAIAAPVYSVPVYSAPTYGPASPVATPQVSGGMVIGDIIDDPSFGLWGPSFLFGGGVSCIVTSPANRPVFIR